MYGRTYLCIDLKSFYASVECVERGLDPMKANLVVADPDRSKGTICLAISPAMKALGVRNRCRVYEIPQNIEYITAPPRMQKYIDYAARIYEVYRKYIHKDDIYVYSIDEVFIDVTEYLSCYNKTPKEMAVILMEEVLKYVGVRAACGIGTNMYLAKVALDITAKHSPDFIGILNEESYRRTLWQHQPITDFWRIGRGTAGRLARYGIHTMEDIALAKEELLYKAFGIDAELLIDHAWGREPVAIADIKSYTPQSTSISRGQVLLRDYTADEGRLILREMLDLMCLDLVEQNSVTGSVCIYIGYSHTCGAPSARGSTSLCIETSSDKIIIPAVLKVYDRIIDSNLPIRRINISFNNLTENSSSVQLSFFEEADSDKLERCLSIQQAVLSIKKRYGKNAVLKGMNFLEGATTRERNDQIGGHKRGA
ncbi:MAG: DNA repair protein [Ruminococcus sp.]|nr:DNA repair protein [Ruminococcus sp.]